MINVLIQINQKNQINLGDKLNKRKVKRKKGDKGLDREKRAKRWEWRNHKEGKIDVIQVKEIKDWCCRFKSRKIT